MTVFEQLYCDGKVIYTASAGEYILRWQSKCTEVSGAG